MYTRVVKRGVGVGLVGAVVFLAAASLPTVGLWNHGSRGDVAAYERIGEEIRHGEVPYRDFYVEYPPGALPMFVAPTLAGEYGRTFRLLAGGLGAVTVVVLAATLASLGASRRRLWCAAFAAGVAPPLLGVVYVLNFDVWPALLTAAALLLLARSRTVAGAAVLGLAFVAKVYPVVLLPLVLVQGWRVGGRRGLVAPLAAFAATAAAVVLPFAALAPGGVGYSLSVQARRPLQIESLGSSVLLAAHQLGLYGGSVNSTGNSQNLSGGLAQALGALSSVALGAALVGIWLLFARGRLTFATASAAAVTAFVAFGRVLSPQYLVWLVPLVLLLRAWQPGVVLALALVLTHLWFPSRYGDLVRLEWPSWLVLMRNLTLMALFVLIVRRRPARSAGRACSA
jgi:glycosyl transferase family 87